MLVALNHKWCFHATLFEQKKNQSGLKKKDCKLARVNLWAWEGYLCHLWHHKGQIWTFFKLRQYCTISQFLNSWLFPFFMTKSFHCTSAATMCASFFLPSHSNRLWGATDGQITRLLLSYSGLVRRSSSWGRFTQDQRDTVFSGNDSLVLRKKGNRVDASQG